MDIYTHAIEKIDKEAANTLENLLDSNKSDNANNA